VLSGQAAAENAGPSVIISFIITGVVALLAALSFSELAAMMPSSGAAYTYTCRSGILLYFYLPFISVFLLL